MKRIAIIALALLLVACSDRVKTEEVVGTALGVVIGGLIGYQFGGGTGTWLTTATGAAVGGTVGYVSGRELAPSDQAAYQKTAVQALAHADDGETVDWSNPKSGYGGTFTPLRTFETADGVLCRDYRATLARKGRVKEGGGQACLTEDGRWTTVTGERG